MSISVVLLRYKPGYIIQDNDGETAQTKDDVDTETELNEDIIAQESDDLAESFTENVTERKKTATTAPNGMNYTNKITDTLSSYQDPKSRSVKNRVWKRMFGLGRRQDEPTEESYMAAEITLAVFILSTIGLQSCVVRGMDRLTSKDPLVIVLFVIFLMWMLLAVDVMARLPESKSELRFKVPFLQFLPLVAIFVNVFLLLELHAFTWIRFGIWMLMGQAIWLDLV